MCIYALHAYTCTEEFQAPIYEVDETGYHWREGLGISDGKKILNCPFMPFYIFQISTMSRCHFITDF